MSQIRLEQTASVSSDKTTPLLSVKDLVVHFRSDTGVFEKQSTVKAVDGVSFDIFESQTVSLVGESGSGKSTIARCLSLLQKPNTGSVIYNGSDIFKLGGRRLHEYHKDVQMIFQDPFESLNPRETAFSAISAPLKLLMGVKGREKLTDEVSKLLEEVGLEPGLIMDRYPHQLSGGERQRVSIARALASKPKMLIADEPITMLDAAQRLNVLSLLGKLRTTRKLTLLMITHDLASAKVLSDKIFVIYLGKIVEAGQANPVLLHPHHPYIELITNSIPKLHESAAGEDDTSILSIEESRQITHGCSFTPRCKYATEICRNQSPELLEKSTGHYAACHNPLNL